MATIRNHRPQLHSALGTAGLPERGLVFVTDATIGDGWEEVAAELTEAFLMSRQAGVAGVPIVYVVDGAALLGQSGTGPAMVACGLLSAARSAAIEGRKGGVGVNVLALEPDTEPQSVAVWCGRLLEGDGPTGELIRLGGAHLGKALP